MTNEPGASAIDVVAALIVQERRLLICQRHERSAFPLKWEFPGGKVEPGEGWVDALKRELKEELDIEIEDPVEIFSHRHVYPAAAAVSLRFFRVTRFHGSLRNRVFRQICWAPVDELPNFEFLGGDLPLIAELVGPGRGRLIFKLL